MLTNRKPRFTLRLNTAKNTHYIKKCFQLKLASIKFLTKKSVAHMSISSRSGAMELERLMFQILYCTEIGKGIQFRAECCENYPLYQKIVQIKVVQNRILYKKGRERTCLFPPGVELEGSKDSYVSNIILYRSGKEDSLSG